MNAYIFLLAFASFIFGANCHGYLQDPPARNCAWRYGYNKVMPTNWDDNELNCGGFGVQWKQNGGKCGVCGDPYNAKTAKHTYPGKFAKGIIVREYKQGQEITLVVKMHTSHVGYMVFNIGKLVNPPVTQDDFTHVLKLSNGGYKYPIPYEHRTYTIKAFLPSDLVCDHCVIQWVYRAGNSWGCENGKCDMGLGEQEHFVNCADVKITKK